MSQCDGVAAMNDANGLTASVSARQVLWRRLGCACNWRITSGNCANCANRSAVHPLSETLYMHRLHHDWRVTCQNCENCRNLADPHCGGRDDRQKGGKHGRA